MNPNIGKRAALYKQPNEKPRTLARQFIELNTPQNISVKRDFVYLEDVKIAINIIPSKKE
jgi:hypothetical protein